MTLSGPLVLIFVPLLLMLLAWLLRRWTALAALVTGLGAAALAWLTATASLENPTALGGLSLIFHEPFLVLGRPLALTASTRWPIVWLFAALALSTLVIAPVAPRSRLFGFSLGITALLVAAQLTTQIVYTALLLNLALLLTIFPLQETARWTRGGLHYIAYATLALPGLMLTQVLLEQYAVTPNQLGQLQAARGLLFIAFAILLGAFPFQAWISNLTRDGAPRMFPFIFSVNLGAVWFVLLDYLETYTWLSEGPFFQLWPGLSGLVMLVLGGILAAAQRRLSRMTGYLLLSEQGLWLMALGLHRPESLALMMGLLFIRPVTLGLVSLGLEGLRATSPEGEDTLEALQGLGRHHPWASAAFILGIWALLGLPLSLNFVLHEALYRLWPEGTLVLLAGAAGGLVGWIRAVRALFTPQESAPVIAWGWPQRAAVIFWSVLLLLSGLFPQPLLRLAETIAHSYTFLSR